MECTCIGQGSETPRQNKSRPCVSAIQCGALGMHVQYTVDCTERGVDEMPGDGSFEMGMHTHMCLNMHRANDCSC